jgi:hypothetical protein
MILTLLLFHYPKNSQVHLQLTLLLKQVKHWSAFCLYGFAYKLHHTMCKVLGLLSFTDCNVLDVHPCCNMNQKSSHFYCWTVFYCMDIPCLLYPFTKWWAFGLFLVFGYSFEFAPRREITGLELETNLVFKFLRNIRPEGLQNLTFPLAINEGSSFPYPYQYLLCLCDCSHSDRCVEVSHYGFNLPLPKYFFI